MDAHRTLVACTLIVALLSACGTTPTPPAFVSVDPTESPTIGTVNTMQNLVEAGPLENLINVPVSQTIHNNEVIRVTNGGMALLNFLDTTVLKLFNDTSLGDVNVEILEAASKRIRMKLERGGLSGQVKKDSGGVGFELPNGAHIYILGTSFYVTYDPETDIVSAGNFDGTVAYQVPGQDPQFLPKGNLIDILPGGVVQVADLPFDIDAFDAAAQTKGSPIQALEDLRVVPTPTVLPPTPTLLPTSCPIPEGWQSVIVQPADTFATIASRYGTTAEILAQGNCLNTPDLVPGIVVYAPPLPAATACVHPAGWITYIVQRGDTLFQIGLIRGVTVTTLQRGNCLDSSQIYTGQRLYVPNVVVPPSSMTISGNVGVGFATLSYVDGTAKTAIADGNGNYSLTVSYNWTGAVTPSQPGYTFSPANRSYTNVVSSQTAQNYSAILTTYTLTVSKTGAGTVTSVPAGIDCGATCTSNFSFFSTVTLTAKPAAGYSFTGWSGACTGTGTCTVTMDAARSVTANFQLPPYALTVSKIGTGTVTSTPAGINCGPTCTYNFPYLTSVTLTATPAQGYKFLFWSGACEGNYTTTCTVTMDAAKSATANFDRVFYALTVINSGGGTVASIPSGINCGSTCTYNFPSSTTVTLTAKAASGYAFSGWSGACIGTATCALTVDGPMTVTATFTLVPTPYPPPISYNGLIQRRLFAL